MGEGTPPAGARSALAQEGRGCRGRPGASLLFEVERQGVDAVAEARRSRAIGEDVAEVRVARAATHLGAAHAVAVVAQLPDVRSRRRSLEARPAAAGVILFFG